MQSANGEHAAPEWLKLTEHNTYEIQLPFLNMEGPRLGRQGLASGLNGYQCGGERAMAVFLSHPDVVEALHVKIGTPGMTYYNRTVADLRPLYKCAALCTVSRGACLHAVGAAAIHSSCMLLLH